MAASLIATAGANNANAYDTLANADTYFGNHPDESTWDALSDDNKNKYLILATTLIDQEPIDGDKYTTTLTSGAPDQRLRFPRAEDYDDGSKFIPFAVKLAMYEQALNLAKTGTSSTRQDLQNQGVTSVTIGDVSETYGSGSGSSTQLCTKARQILAAAGLLKVGGVWA